MNQPRVYAAYSKNEYIRQQSSSGGIFTEIAQCIIADGGVVIGCAMDEKLHAKHIVVCTSEDLCKLRGSKYVQSDLRGIYNQCIEYLKQGKKVMFTGTPCQVEALYRLSERILDREQKSLLFLVDVICHGVPEAKVWEKYVKVLEKSEKKNIINVNFRSKTHGWSEYQVCYKFNDGTEKMLSPDKDIYMKGFLNDVYLRLSCYSCKCRKLNRNSDITLGDFWGIGNIFKDFDSGDKGSSVLVVHSEKGELLIKRIESVIYLKEATIEGVLKGNPSYMYSPKWNKSKWTKFWNEFEDIESFEDFKKIVNICINKKYLTRFYYKLRRFMAGLRGK